MPDDNGWNEYKRDVYNRFDEVDKTLDKLSTNVEAMTAKLSNYVTDNEVFKKEIRLKASFWGAISGAIPVLITVLIGLLIYFIQKK